MMSPMPWVPLDKARVCQLSRDLAPGLLKQGLVVDAHCADGKSLPRGSLTRLSPDEVAHAVVFKIAERLEAGASIDEKKQWLRMLLSCPMAFRYAPGPERHYAEANSLRQDIMGTSAVVRHSARQLVYNIYGFKVQQEKNGKTYSAKDIASFWAQNVRLSKGDVQMAKPGTIDTCLTIYNRLFSIPECEDLIKQSEEMYGADGPWASIWTTQELIYRCQTKGKLAWTLAAINDWIQSEKIQKSEVTASALKAGPRSLSDVAVMTFQLKNYLLGAWLDSKAVCSAHKDKIKEVFSSHMNYRTLYSPFNDVADVNWRFGLAKAGQMVVDFIEQTLYLHGGSEEALLRQAHIVAHVAHVAGACPGIRAGACPGKLCGIRARAGACPGKCCI